MFQQERMSGLMHMIDEQLQALRLLWKNKRQVAWIINSMDHQFVDIYYTLQNSHAHHTAIQWTQIFLPHTYTKNTQLLFQTLNLGMVVLSALMIWKSLMVVTKSESPVVVVLRCVAISLTQDISTEFAYRKHRICICSGSMEPAFQRGDILFLNNQVNYINSSVWTTCSTGRSVNYLFVWLIELQPI